MGKGKRLKRGVTMPGGHEQPGAIPPDKYKWVISFSPPEKEVGKVYAR